MICPANDAGLSEVPLQAPDAAPLWKRLLDLALIVVCLPVLFPLMSVIAVLIKCVSKGPVLFRQTRVGVHGKKFTCLKFRTMTAGADTSVHQGHLARLMESNVPMKKMDLKDSRLIPMGLGLRLTGLDELPQVINVLRGEMSLVGPRPCLPFEYDRYLPWQRERFHALPGLTGLWQVSGKNRTTFEEMVALDIRYAREKSLWMDLKIVSGTVPALFQQVLDARREKAKHRLPGESMSRVNGPRTGGLKQEFSEVP